MASYHERYTWSHFMEGGVVAHRDGATSVIVLWDGVDAELLDPERRRAQWSQFYQLLHRLPADHVAEFHWWREADASLAEEYRRFGARRILRGEPLASAVREAMAEHLGAFAYRNRVALVLTRLPAPRWPWQGVRRALARQGQEAQALRATATGLVRHLPGGRLGTVTDFLGAVQQSLHRRAWLRRRPPALDPHFALNEQWVRDVPRLEEGRLLLGGERTKVLFVYLYPDAPPNWLDGMSHLHCAMHVSHMVQPRDMRAALGAADAAERLTASGAGESGAAFARRKLLDVRAFKEFVVDHGLGVFGNCYVIHLHGDPDTLARSEEAITDWIEGAQGQVRAQDYIQEAFFRAGLPGQGHRAPLYRPDHTWQVGNMLPVQVGDAGDADAESLRLTSSSELVRCAVTNQTVAHGFTIAMTGAGKGVETCATIAESYPCGTDWYVLEIGGSYRWLFEGLGGQHITLDPDHHAANPLPAYRLASPDGEAPLDARLSEQTLAALAFLVTGGRSSLSAFEKAAGEMALQMLYAGVVDPDIPGAPHLGDYLEELRRADYFAHDEEAVAARRMADHLESFLNTSVGRRFTEQDNLQLQEGLCALDLKDVLAAGPELVRFYLVFAGLQLAHLAFYASRRPARVLIDELHKFVEVAPDTIGPLASAVARMGRKEAAGLHLVTQDTREIDLIEQAIIDNMPNRQWLYYDGDHGALAARVGMPPGPLARWRAFDYPIGLPYRQAVRRNGRQYHDLTLTFPPLLLDLADTDPWSLDAKRRIEAQERDVFRRLDRFRKAKEAAHG